MDKGELVTSTLCYSYSLISSIRVCTFKIIELPSHLITKAPGLWANCKISDSSHTVYHLLRSYKHAKKLNEVFVFSSKAKMGVWDFLETVYNYAVSYRLNKTHNRCIVWNARKRRHNYFKKVPPEMTFPKFYTKSLLLGTMLRVYDEYRTFIINFYGFYFKVFPNKFNKVICTNLRCTLSEHTSTVIIVFKSMIFEAHKLRV